MIIYGWYKSVRWLVGWIDVTWDSGGSNSYRMGAEGKYDLALAPGYDPEKHRAIPTKADQGAKAKTGVAASDKVKVSLYLQAWYTCMQLW